MEMRVGQDKQSTQMMSDTISKFYVIRSQSEIVVPVVILSLKGTSIKRKQSSVQGGDLSLYLFIHLSNNSDLIRFQNKVTINVSKTSGILNQVFKSFYYFMKNICQLIYTFCKRLPGYQFILLKADFCRRSKSYICVFKKIGKEQFHWETMLDLSMGNTLVFNQAHYLSNGQAKAKGEWFWTNH